MHLRQRVLESSAADVLLQRLSGHAQSPGQPQLLTPDGAASRRSSPAIGLVVARAGPDSAHPRRRQSSLWGGGEGGFTPPHRTVSRFKLHVNAVESLSVFQVAHSL